jgi:hypothetical protein
MSAAVPGRVVGALRPPECGGDLRCDARVRRLWRTGTDRRTCGIFAAFRLEHTDMSESDFCDDWPASALQAADRAFTALGIDPAPLALDCAALTAAAGTTHGTAADTTPPAGADLDLPAGDVPLPALRDWLMAHPHAYAARDAVWRELIRRARQGHPQWVIAAVGMAMPALVASAGQLAAGYRGDPADIDAEVLTGFLDALRTTVDPAQDAPHASLCFAAWRAGRDLRLAQQEYVLVDDIEHAAAESRMPPIPYGHPDLLVYRAQALKILDAEDVEPYIAVRLGHRALEPIAEARRVDLDLLRMRLNRADTRLAKALASGILTGTCSSEARDQLARRAAHRSNVRAGKAAARRAARPQPAPTAAAAAA